MNIKAEQDKKFARVAVPDDLWRQTWTLLRRLGGGQAESACVWGGTRTADRALVSRIYPIDGDHGVERGCLSHRMSKEGVARLFAQLRADGLGIVADVHTHPEDWVGLSEVDMEHPIEFRRGLVCLVLPNYASSPPELNATGVHIYLGDGEWFECGRGDLPRYIEVI